MIELKNLTKKYGHNTAVNNLSVKINDGEIVGFLGPNGAGKSTTMNMMTGYISSTSGSVVIDGHDILKEPEAAKRLIGYLPEQPPLYSDMTVCEYLNFVYDLKKVCGVERKEHIDYVMDVAKISQVRSRLLRNLSKGYRQRVGIAQALVGNPKVLILDEPTVGLDPAQIQEIRSLIKTLGNDRTVILSSHILSEISYVCDKVMIINNGKLLVYDTLSNINRKLSGSSVYIATVIGERNTVLGAINKIPGVGSVSVRESAENGAFDYVITPSHGKDIRNLFLETVAKEKLNLVALNSKKMSLEEVFLKVTSKKNH